jgi:hypothetical protein
LKLNKPPVARGFFLSLRAFLLKEKKQSATADMAANKLLCSFLSIRNERKEACSAKELRNFFFVQLKEINLSSQGEDFKQYFFFNASIRKNFLRNSFEEQNRRKRNLIEVIKRSNNVKVC